MLEQTVSLARKTVVSLTVMLLLGLAAALTAQASQCTDKCWDKYYDCKERCGPDSSEGSSCLKKCTFRRDRCLDECYGRTTSNKKDSSTSSISSVTKEPEEKDYCYEYLPEIKELELKAMQAEDRENYCSAISSLSKAVKKINRAPETCEQDPQWMTIFYRKKKRFSNKIDELKPFCSSYKSSSKGGPIKVKKSAGGITLTQ